jgi:uncharacterized membrane protein
MVRVEDSIIVNRPIEEVFAYVTDIERFPEWTSFVRRAEKTSDGPVGLATTLRTDLQFLGRQFTSEQVITEFVPNRVFAGKSVSGPLPMTITTTVEPAGGGTKVTQSIEGESKGFFGLADPILEQVGKRQLHAQLGTLKDLLESGAASTTP